MSGGETIEVNGTSRLLTLRTVAELLESLGHGGTAPGIAVAVNGEVVRRSAWDARRLHAGDRVEIVGAVQGG